MKPKIVISIILVVSVISGYSFIQQKPQEIPPIFQEPENFVGKIQSELDPELAEIYSIQPISAGFYLSIGVLTFGLILMCLAIFMTLKRPEGWGIHSTRIIGLILSETPRRCVLITPTTSPHIVLLGFHAGFLYI